VPGVPPTGMGGGAPTAGMDRPAPSSPLLEAVSRSSSATQQAGDSPKDSFKRHEFISKPPPSCAVATNCSVVSNNSVVANSLPFDQELDRLLGDDDPLEAFVGGMLGDGWGLHSEGGAPHRRAALAGVAMARGDSWLAECMAPEGREHAGAGANENTFSDALSDALSDAELAELINPDAFDAE